MAASGAVVLLAVVAVRARKVVTDRPSRLWSSTLPGVQWRFGWIRGLGFFVPALAAATLALIAAWLFRRWRSQPVRSAAPTARFVVAAVVGGFGVAGAGLAVGVVLRRPELGADTAQRDSVQALLVAVGVTITALAGWTVARHNLRPAVGGALLAVATIAFIAGAPVAARHGVATNAAVTSWASGPGFWESRIVVRSDGAFGYSVISCPTAMVCLALGAGAVGALDTVTSTDGGTTWTATPLPKASQRPGGETSLAQFVTGLGCVDQRRCVAATPQLITTTDSGARWSPVGNAQRFLSWALACAPSTACVAVGDTTPPSASGAPSYRPAAMFSLDGGATWSAAQLPAGNWRLSGAACTTTLVCFATGWDTTTKANSGVFFVSRNAGREWNRLPTNGDLPMLTTIACPDAVHCLALGISAGHGVAVTTGDAGSTWSQHPIGSPIRTSSQLACGGDAGRCLIAYPGLNGITISATLDGGQTWRTAAALPQVASRSFGPALACLTPGTCLLGASNADSDHGIILRSDTTGTIWKPMHTAAP